MIGCYAKGSLSRTCPRKHRTRKPGMSSFAVKAEAGTRFSFSATCKVKVDSYKSAVKMVKLLMVKCDDE